MKLKDELEKNTYPQLMQDTLSKAPNDVDKREGSIIFDTIASICYPLAFIYVLLRTYLDETFVDTATGKYLDMKAIEIGIERRLASKSLCKGFFVDIQGNPADMAIGLRFSSIETVQPIYFSIKEEYNGTKGYYLLECEQAGTIGNQYYGELRPLDHIRQLQSATLLEIIIPAQDEESDTAFRARYFDRVKNKPFGGNIADYKNWLFAIDGVGAVQVYPIWSGGGTVKISVLDINLLSISDDFISIIMKSLDLENYEGEKGTGLGIAPIGHKVTVTTPSVVTIDIECDVILQDSWTVPQIEAGARENLEKYLLSIRTKWDKDDEQGKYTMILYLAQVIGAFLELDGIINITNLKVNNTTDDIYFINNASQQEIPVLGDVKINEI